MINKVKVEAARQKHKFDAKISSCACSRSLRCPRNTKMISSRSKSSTCSTQTTFGSGESHNCIYFLALGITFLFIKSVLITLCIPAFLQFKGLWMSGLLIWRSLSTQRWSIILREVVTIRYAMLLFCTIGLELLLDPILNCRSCSL